ncbi:hypothetical protein AOC36_09520 [Erysipelothrix larvae]|uniref:Phage tail protein n=1 Tax=Erysipelothrix larvae TaxID=1514105 RepID=A0A0X8H171_9FIRM|nr:hypothetical protein [Erysipelothrix larvae]AMC94212.1 hypothetical protein AOC36_09520 [Erysipelothrix larvae]
MSHPKIVYKGRGGEVDFTKPPLLYVTNSFADSEISISSEISSDGIGTYISQFQYVKNEFKISVVIWGDVTSVLNELSVIFMNDIRHNSPGKLYVNDTYINCYITASTKTNWNRYHEAVTVEFKIYAPTPLWILEKTYSFFNGVSSQNEDGFSFPISLPTHFASKVRPYIIEEPLYFDLLAKISFFGPAVNPTIWIDGRQFSVTGELLTGERIEIDQLTKSVVKITASGETINMFNSRLKSPSMFTALIFESGLVEYNRSFPIEIITYERLVEPIWK